MELTAKIRPAMVPTERVISRAYIPRRRSEVGAIDFVRMGVAAPGAFAEGAVPDGFVAAAGEEACDLKLGCGALLMGGRILPAIAAGR